MTGRDWIREKINEGLDNSEIYLLYNEFKNEIESKSNYESFKRDIREVREKSGFKENKSKINDILKNIDNSNNLSINNSDNEIEIDSKSDTIKTLDELIKSCKINLNDWIIENSTINKWDMISKDRGVVELFQIKCRLLRKNPENQKTPDIHPININVSLSKDGTKSNLKNNKLKKCLIIPDSQNGYRNENGKLNPFHDRRCWDLMLQLNKRIKPNKIVLLGDMLDCAEFSEKFLKSKEFYFTMQASLIELGWLLSQLRLDNKEADIYYLAGNHEERVSKAFINHMIYAYDLKRYDEESIYPITSIPYMLNLSKINIKYVGPYPKDSEIWINDNLVAEHGSVVKSESGETVKAIINKTRCSRIVGHIHRFEMTSKTVYVKKGSITYTVFSPGTIAKIDGTVPSYSGKENWQQGCAIVDYEEGNGLFKINPIPILDGKMIFENNILIGTDNYVSQLNRDTGSKF